MNMSVETNANLNEIYEGLTNGLYSCREQDLAPGCKRVIVYSEDCSLTFDFISKQSGLSATDHVTVQYQDRLGHTASAVVYSAEQALSFVQDYIPDKMVSSRKHM